MWRKLLLAGKTVSEFSGCNCDESKDGSSGILRSIVSEKYTKASGAYCIHHQGVYQNYDSPDDRGNKHFRSVGVFFRDYTAQHPRRQSCSGKFTIFYIFSSSFFFLLDTGKITEAPGVKR
jgi:hypothetical protein